MNITKSHLSSIINEEINEALSRREAEVLAYVTPYVQGLIARLDNAIRKGRISSTEYEQHVDDAIEDATHANLERGKYDSIDDYILSHCRTFEKYKERPDWFEPLKDYLDDENVVLGPEAEACVMKYLGESHLGILKNIFLEELKAVLTHEKIEKRGDKHVVTTDDGSKTLGTHDTEKEARAQHYAIHKSQEEHGDK